VAPTPLRTFNALVPVFAEPDEISGVVEMERGVTSSLAQMVIEAHTVKRDK
jgi:hypothetical protein